MTLVVGILAAAVGGYAYVAVPRQAELAFGKPAAGLGTSQRLRLSALLVLQKELLKQPWRVQAEAQTFRVAAGESTFEITERLQAEGLLGDAAAMRNYLVYAGLDTTIQAGEYTLSARMSPVEIAHALQDATPGQVVYRVLDGWRLDEIAASLPTSGLSFSPSEFMTAAMAPPGQFMLENKMPPGATLEGFLFPDSYRFDRQVTLDAFLGTLMENFRTKVGFDLRQGFTNQGLSVFQAVTLASIIEREAVVDDEMPMIASVFYNRLAQGMRLDTDPTVQYALGFNTAQNTWWTNPLSLADLQVDSPYNTYRNTGLPPGPIAAASLNALRAVAFPAQTPYFFFRAACDGSGRHLFAITFEEHRQNACR